MPKQSMLTFREVGEEECVTHVTSYILDRETITVKKDGVEVTNNWP